MSASLRFLHFIAYLSFRFCEGCMRLVSIDFAFTLGRVAGEISYRTLRRRRAIALRNLRLAFGAEMSEQELRAINREHFQLLGANLFSGLKAFTLPREKIWSRVATTVPAERPETGWVALMSHVGNWELYSYMAEKFPDYHFGAVYQSLANPFIDGYIRKARKRAGIRLFDRRTELLSCVRFLREGGVVGILIDQAAGYAGLWTPLFRRLTSSSTLAASLSIRTGVPVLPIAINTRGQAQWTLTAYNAVRPETDDVELLTAQINRVLEEEIRRAPADWLWAHNRWKPLRPHILFARDQRRVFLPPDFDRSTLDLFRILIVAPNSRDAALAAVPAVQTIKRGRPDNWLAIFTRDDLSETWKNEECVDHVIPWSGGESISSLISKIRHSANFDAAIFFEQDLKTSMAVWIAGIPVRAGLRSGMSSWFYNQHPLEPDQPFDPVRMNLHIAQSVGANINDALLQMTSSPPVTPTV